VEVEGWAIETADVSRGCYLLKDGARFIVEW